MTSLEGLIVIDKDSDLAVYLQIANCIVHGIRSGRLRRGSRLAGSREVAALLSVHRKTMIAAYEELQAQGWIEMIPRKGTFVMCDLPDIKPKKILAGEALVRYPDKTAFAVVDANTFPYTSTTPHHGNSLVLNDGFPDVRLAPTDLFLREYRSIARRQAFRKYHEYGSAQGPDLLLDTLSSFLSDTRALPITRSNLMITKGAQMGIYLAAHVLLKPGDHVVVGEPSYFAATRTFMHAGAKNKPRCRRRLRHRRGRYRGALPQEDYPVGICYSASPPSYHGYAYTRAPAAAAGAGNTLSLCDYRGRLRLRFSLYKQSRAAYGEP